MSEINELRGRLAEFACELKDAQSEEEIQRLQAEMNDVRLRIEKLLAQRARSFQTL